MLHVCSVITDGMAKLVFIQYDKIGELLEPVQRKDSKMKRQIISDVLSASIGQSDNQPASAVPQTITFTFKTGEVRTMSIHVKYVTLQE